MSDNLLVLVCAVKTCRWRPPGDLQISLLEAHFDLEEGHDPEQLRLEMVAWCHRCDVEMNFDRTEQLRGGRQRHHYSCAVCHRRDSVAQDPKEEPDGQ